jgi:hypothetical protein
MAEWMALTGALAATLLGFAWLALAMEDHWQQVHGETAPPQATQRGLRMMGAAGLIVSGVLCFAADRPSMAALVWILLMAFGAVAVALTLSWKPALLRLAFPRRKS